MRRASPIAIFCLAAAVFALVHATPAFGDPDAYYHLWMAKRLLASGPVRSFSRLPFTTLADHFADQHFLYHLALAPFIGLFGDFWGLKIATVLFAALAMAVFCRLLEAYGVRRPMLWTLPLLFAPGFLFRLLLTKATALALAALFLFLIALKERKRRTAFAIAFGYVWLHGSWPLLIVAALADACARRSTKCLTAVFLGLGCGLVFNPFFPQNLFFYWEQIVRVAVIGNGASGVLVGQEWSPTDPVSLLAENFLVFLPLLAVTALTALTVRRGQPIRAEAVPAERRRDILSLGALALILLLMTVRQSRHKEYFLPLLLAASALAGDSAFAAIDVRELATRVKARCGRAWRPIVGAILLALALFAGFEAMVSQQLYARRLPWTRFAEAGAWMRAHLPPDAIVFQTGFNDMPYLLYRDDAQRYLIGLDPRFFSDKDIAKYWEWRDISEGRRRVGLAGLIEKDFGARYVFLDRDHEPLSPLIRKDPSFVRVYQDEEAEVWRVDRSRTAPDRPVSGR